MKKFALLLIGIMPLFAQSQSALMDSLIWLNYQYRISENAEFADSSHSPLTEEDRQHFYSLNWFPIDTNFIVWASLELTPEAKPFEMPTTTDRMAKYRQYAFLTFSLSDSIFKIPVYQNLRLLGKKGYEDYLFLPFTDLSNGFGTYGGGRYLDFRMPPGDSLLIDFNRAYNPYCAYNGRYSCPIPPPKNHINFKIKAGVRYEVTH